ncbi:MAG: hypothetical protein MPK05_02400 [Gammaproteobacteria bacterium]|nr:hypothetical protein [Gammaproteobacteria bacterium]
MKFRARPKPRDFTRPAAAAMGKSFYRHKKVIFRGTFSRRLFRGAFHRRFSAALFGGEYGGKKARGKPRVTPRESAPLLSAHG